MTHFGFRCGVFRGLDLLPPLGGRLMVFKVLLRRVLRRWTKCRRCARLWCRRLDGAVSWWVPVCECALRMWFDLAPLVGTPRGFVERVRESSGDMCRRMPGWSQF